MLERLVAWVMNNYLGKYVENLNTDQLSIALLQGSVELENLPLKKDAFRHFGLPMNIKYGVIGKIKLKVPVTQLRSAPWSISIEHLTVVLNPLSLAEWDEEAEEISAHQYKLSILDSLEANWRATHLSNCQDASYYASSYYSWFNYGSGLVSNIIDNIQLEIKDVSIRYEDTVTTENSFCVGFALDILSLQCSNENWQTGYTIRNLAEKYSYQLMQLTGFSIYLDKDKNPNKEQTEDSQINQDNVKHCYILPPVSSEARLKRNRSSVPLRSKNLPRIICDLVLDCVPIMLSDAQYLTLYECTKGLKRIQKCRKYIRFRPDANVKGNPKAWWKYCFNCFRYKARGSIEKYISWDQCALRAKENIAYVKLYSELLCSGTGPSISDPVLKELKTKVEWERGFEELRSLREIAMFRSRNIHPSVNEQLSGAGISTLFQWFPQWWGWYSTSDNVNNESSQQSESPVGGNIVPDKEQLESLEDEILDAIADTIENNTILRRDTIFGQFNFTLKRGKFSLCSTSATVAGKYVIGMYTHEDHEIPV